METSSSICTNCNKKSVQNNQFCDCGHFYSSTIRCPWCSYTDRKNNQHVPFGKIKIMESNSLDEGPYEFGTQFEVQCIAEAAITSINQVHPTRTRSEIISLLKNIEE